MKTIRKSSYSLYSRQPEKNNTKKKFWTIFVLTTVALFFVYCFLRPSDTGVLGTFLNNIFTKFCGLTRFFIPLIMFYWVWYSLKSKKQNLTTDIVLSIILFILVSGIVRVFVEILHFSSEEITKYAGWLGNNVMEVFHRIFGKIFGSIVVIMLTLYVLTVMFEISLVDLIDSAYVTIIEDVRRWYNEIKIKKPQKVVQSRYEKMNRVVQPAQNIKETLTIPKEKLVQSIQPKDKEPEIDTKEIKSKIKQKLSVEPEEKIKPEEQKEIIQKVEYKLPPVSLLTLETQQTATQINLESQAKQLENVLKEFDIEAKVVNISSGPTVTMYELELSAGIRVQSVVALKDNIALRMKAESIRIVAPLPGRGTIGVEISNPKTKIVKIRELLESEEYMNLSKEMQLPIAIGKTVDGKPYIADITPMPHLLIAGATGSGKSVCVHAIIISLLYKCSFDELKLVLIDPKRLELIAYNGIPHLYDPTKEPQNVKVITSPKEAAKVLTALVKVMEQRYEKFAHYGVRNIEGYNELVLSENCPKEIYKKKEYYIVVIIDEFADLILTVPKEVEDAIQRLAQMARAVGIHLILATQRPSVDVITGVIKANFSSRIAFQVLSKVDSRVILDTIGAEELLGRGDMLFLPTGAAKPIRLQGAYVSQKEIENVVEFIKQQKIQPDYIPVVKVLSQQLPKERELEQRQSLYEALKLINERKRVSQDLLKAYFRSSAKATDILSLLEIKGFIYKPEGTNRWSINFDKVNEELAIFESEKGKQEVS